MVRETRYLWIGNIPEKVSEDDISEHFQSYGKIQSVKFVGDEDGKAAVVAFMDIKSASKAHSAENILAGKLVETQYSEASGKVTKVTRTSYEGETVARSTSQSSVRYDSSKPGYEGYNYGSYYPGSGPSQGKEGSERWTQEQGEYYSQERGRSRQRFTHPPEYYKQKSYEGYPGGPRPRAGQSPGKPDVPTGITRTVKQTPQSYQSRSRSRSTSSSSSGSRSTSTSRSRRSSSKTERKRGSVVVQPHKKNTQVEERTSGEKLGLLLRGFPPRSSDTSIRDGLFHEYKKCGKVMSVSISGEKEDRYAIVTFKKAEDAAKALEQARSRVFFGRKVDAELHAGVDDSLADYRPPEAELDEYHHKATRTLFVGNLQTDISKETLKDTFKRYGLILDIDIKDQQPNQVFAFVQFDNIKSVVAALHEMDGETVGNSKVKLGFGRSMPTNVLWVDNVTEQVQERFLKQQFCRVVPVNYVLIDRDTSRALVFYDSNEFALMSLSAMRGKAIASKKIQLDFASTACMNALMDNMEHTGQLRPEDRPDQKGFRQYPPPNTESYEERPGYERGKQQYYYDKNYRGQGSFRGRGRPFYPVYDDNYKQKRYDENYAADPAKYGCVTDDFDRELHDYKAERVGYKGKDGAEAVESSPHRGRPSERFSDQGGKEDYYESRGSERYKDADSQSGDRERNTHGESRRDKYEDKLLKDKILEDKRNDSKRGLSPGSDYSVGYKSGHRTPSPSPSRGRRSSKDMRIKSPSVASRHSSPENASPKKAYTPSTTLISEIQRTRPRKHTTKRESESDLTDLDRALLKTDLFESPPRKRQAIEENILRARREAEGNYERDHHLRQSGSHSMDYSGLDNYRETGSKEDNYNVRLDSRIHPTGYPEGEMESKFSTPSPSTKSESDKTPESSERHSGSNSSGDVDMLEKEKQRLLIELQDMEDNGSVSDGEIRDEEDDLKKKPKMEEVFDLDWSPSENNVKKWKEKAIKLEKDNHLNEGHNNKEPHPKNAHTEPPPRPPEHSDSNDSSKFKPIDTKKSFRKQMEEMRKEHDMDTLSSTQRGPKNGQGPRESTSEIAQGPEMVTEKNTMDTSTENSPEVKRMKLNDFPKVKGQRSYRTTRAEETSLHSGDESDKQVKDKSEKTVKEKSHRSDSDKSKSPGVNRRESSDSRHGSSQDTPKDTRSRQGSKDSRDGSHSKKDSHSRRDRSGESSSRKPSRDTIIIPDEILDVKNKNGVYEKAVLHDPRKYPEDFPLPMVLPLPRFAAKICHTPKQSLKSKASPKCSTSSKSQSPLFSPDPSPAMSKSSQDVNKDTASKSMDESNPVEKLNLEVTPKKEIPMELDTNISNDKLGCDKNDQKPTVVEETRVAEVKQEPVSYEITKDIEPVAIKIEPANTIKQEQEKKEESTTNEVVLKQGDESQLNLDIKEECSKQAAELDKTNASSSAPKDKIQLNIESPVIEKTEPMALNIKESTDTEKAMSESSVAPPKENNTPNKEKNFDSDLSDIDNTPAMQSLDEQIRALDEKLEQQSTVNARRTLNIDTQIAVTPLSTTAPYRERFRVRKRGDSTNSLSSLPGSTSATPMTTDSKSEQSDYVRSLLSRSSIFDQDSRRLEQIDEKYQPKEYNLNLDRPTAVGFGSDDDDSNYDSRVKEYYGLGHNKAPSFPSAILRQPGMGNEEYISSESDTFGLGPSLTFAPPGSLANQEVANKFGPQALSRYPFLAKKPSFDWSKSSPPHPGTPVIDTLRSPTLLPRDPRRDPLSPPLVMPPSILKKSPVTTPVNTSPGVSSVSPFSPPGILKKTEPGPSILKKSDSQTKMDKDLESSSKRDDVPDNSKKETKELLNDEGKPPIELTSSTGTGSTANSSQNNEPAVQKNEFCSGDGVQYQSTPSPPVLVKENKQQGIGTKNSIKRSASEAFDDKAEKEDADGPPQLTESVNIESAQKKSPEDKNKEPETKKVKVNAENTESNSNKATIVSKSCLKKEDKSSKPSDTEQKAEKKSNEKLSTSGEKVKEIVNSSTDKKTNSKLTSGKKSTASSKNSHSKEKVSPDEKKPEKKSENKKNDVKSNDKKTSSDRKLVEKKTNDKVKVEDKKSSKSSSSSSDKKSETKHHSSEKKPESKAVDKKGDKSDTERKSSKGNDKNERKPVETSKSKDKLNEKHRHLSSTSSVNSSKSEGSVSAKSADTKKEMKHDKASKDISKKNDEHLKEKKLSVSTETKVKNKHTEDSKTSQKNMSENKNKEHKSVKDPSRLKSEHTSKTEKDSKSPDKTNKSNEKKNDIIKSEKTSTKKEEPKVDKVDKNDKMSNKLEKHVKHELKNERATKLEHNVLQKNEKNKESHKSSHIIREKSKDESRHEYKNKVDRNESSKIKNNQSSHNKPLKADDNKKNKQQSPDKKMKNNKIIEKSEPLQEKKKSPADRKSRSNSMTGETRELKQLLESQGLDADNLMNEPIQFFSMYDMVKRRTHKEVSKEEAKAEEKANQQKKGLRRLNKMSGTDSSSDDDSAFSSENREKKKTPTKSKVKQNKFLESSSSDFSSTESDDSVENKKHTKASPLMKKPTKRNEVKSRGLVSSSSASSSDSSSAESTKTESSPVKKTKSTSKKITKTIESDSSSSDSESENRPPSLKKSTISPKSQTSSSKVDKLPAKKGNRKQVQSSSSSSSSESSDDNSALPAPPTERKRKTALEKLELTFSNSGSDSSISPCSVSTKQDKKPVSKKPSGLFSDSDDMSVSKSKIKSLKPGKSKKIITSSSDDGSDSTSSSDSDSGIKETHKKQIEKKPKEVVVKNSNKSPHKKDKSVENSSAKVNKVTSPETKSEAKENKLTSGGHKHKKSAEDATPKVTKSSSDKESAKVSPHNKEKSVKKAEHIKQNNISSEATKASECCSKKEPNITEEEKGREEKASKMQSIFFKPTDNIVEKIDANSDVSSVSLSDCDDFTPTKTSKSKKSEKTEKKSLNSKMFDTSDSESEAEVKLQISETILHQEDSQQSESRPITPDIADSPEPALEIDNQGVLDGESEVIKQEQLKQDDKQVKRPESPKSEPVKNTVVETEKAVASIEKLWEESSSQPIIETGIVANIEIQSENVEEVQENEIVKDELVADDETANAVLSIFGVPLGENDTVSVINDPELAATLANQEGDVIYQIEDGSEAEQAVAALVYESTEVYDENPPFTEESVAENKEQEINISPDSVEQNPVETPENVQSVQSEASEGKLTICDDVVEYETPEDNILIGKTEEKIVISDIPLQSSVKVDPPTNIEVPVCEKKDKISVSDVALVKDQKLSPKLPKEITCKGNILESPTKSDVKPIENHMPSLVKPSTSTASETALAPPVAKTPLKEKNPPITKQKLIAPEKPVVEEIKPSPFFSDQLANPNKLQEIINPNNKKSTKKHSDEELIPKIPSFERLSSLPSKPEPFMMSHPLVNPPSFYTERKDDAPFYITPSFSLASKENNKTNNQTSTGLYTKHNEITPNKVPSLNDDFALSNFAVKEPIKSKPLDMNMSMDPKLFSPNNCYIENDKIRPVNDYTNFNFMKNPQVPFQPNNMMNQPRNNLQPYGFPGMNPMFPSTGPNFIPQGQMLNKSPPNQPFNKLQDQSINRNQPNQMFSRGQLEPPFNRTNHPEVNNMNQMNHVAPLIDRGHPDLAMNRNPQIPSYNRNLHDPSYNRIPSNNTFERNPVDQFQRNQFPNYQDRPQANYFDRNVVETTNTAPVLSNLDRIVPDKTLNINVSQPNTQFNQIISPKEKIVEKLEKNDLPKQPKENKIIELKEEKVEPNKTESTSKDNLGVDKKEIETLKEATPEEPKKDFTFEPKKISELKTYEVSNTFNISNSPEADSQVHTPQQESDTDRDKEESDEKDNIVYEKEPEKEAIPFEDLNDFEDEEDLPDLIIDESPDGSKACSDDESNEKDQNEPKANAEILPDGNKVSPSTTSPKSEININVSERSKPLVNIVAEVSLEAGEELEGGVLHIVEKENHVLQPSITNANSTVDPLILTPKGKKKVKGNKKNKKGLVNEASEPGVLDEVTKNDTGMDISTKSDSTLMKSPITRRKAKLDDSFDSPQKGNTKFSSRGRKIIPKERADGVATMLRKGRRNASASSTGEEQEQSENGRKKTWPLRNRKESEVSEQDSKEENPNTEENQNTGTNVQETPRECAPIKITLRRTLRGRKTNARKAKAAVSGEVVYTNVTETDIVEPQETTDPPPVETPNTEEVVKTRRSRRVTKGRKGAKNASPATRTRRNDGSTSPRSKSSDGSPKDLSKSYVKLEKLNIEQGEGKRDDDDQKDLYEWIDDEDKPLPEYKVARATRKRKSNENGSTTESPQKSETEVAEVKRTKKSKAAAELKKEAEKKKDVKVVENKPDQQKVGPQKPEAEKVEPVPEPRKPDMNDILQGQRGHLPLKLAMKWESQEAARKEREAKEAAEKAAAEKAEADVKSSDDNKSAAVSDHVDKVIDEVARGHFEKSEEARIIDKKRGIYFREDLQKDIPKDLSSKPGAVSHSQSTESMSSSRPSSASSAAPTSVMSHAYDVEPQNTAQGQAIKRVPNTSIGSVPEAFTQPGLTKSSPQPITVAVPPIMSVSAYHPSPQQMSPRSVCGASPRMPVPVGSFNHPYTHPGIPPSQISPTSQASELRAALAQPSKLMQQEQLLQQQRMHDRHGQPQLSPHLPDPKQTSPTMSQHRMPFTVPEQRSTTRADPKATTQAPIPSHITGPDAALFHQDLALPDLRGQMLIPGLGVPPHMVPFLPRLMQQHYEQQILNLHHTQAAAMLSQYQPQVADRHPHDQASTGGRPPSRHPTPPTAQPSPRGTPHHHSPQVSTPLTPQLPQPPIAALPSRVPPLQHLTNGGIPTSLPDGMIMAVQQYPMVWQGYLYLKNDASFVQMHFVTGNRAIIAGALDTPKDSGIVRIAQRMRLEPTQLEGVAKRMQKNEEFSMLVAVPYGKDQLDFIHQTGKLQTGFIQYLQQKQAAGIVNIPNPLQPGYVVHIFPPCEFSSRNITEKAPELNRYINDMSYLVVVITST